jgi:hypothetical protein
VIGYVAIKAIGKIVMLKTKVLRSRELRQADQVALNRRRQAQATPASSAAKR